MEERRCRDCDEVISKARLAVKPHAFRCVRCDEKHDVVKTTGAMITDGKGTHIEFMSKDEAVAIGRNKQRGNPRRSIR